MEILVFYTIAEKDIEFSEILCYTLSKLNTCHRVGKDDSILFYDDRSLQS